MQAKRSPLDLVAVVVIIAVASDRLLLGIGAVLLLRILHVVLDVRNSLDERPEESASN